MTDSAVVSANTRAIDATSDLVPVAQRTEGVRIQTGGGTMLQAGQDPFRGYGYNYAGRAVTGTVLPPWYGPIDLGGITGGGVIIPSQLGYTDQPMAVRSDLVGPDGVAVIPNKPVAKVAATVAPPVVETPVVERKAPEPAVTLTPAAATVVEEAAPATTVVNVPAPATTTFVQQPTSTIVAPSQNVITIPRRRRVARPAPTIVSAPAVTYTDAYDFADYSYDYADYSPSYTMPAVSYTAPLPARRVARPAMRAALPATTYAHDDYVAPALSYAAPAYTAPAYTAGPRSYGAGHIISRKVVGVTASDPYFDTPAVRATMTTGTGQHMGTSMATGYTANQHVRSFMGAEFPADQYMQSSSWGTYDFGAPTYSHSYSPSYGVSSGYYSGMGHTGYREGYSSYRSPAYGGAISSSTALVGYSGGRTSALSSYPSSHGYSGMTRSYTGGRTAITSSKKPAYTTSYDYPPTMEF